MARFIVRRLVGMIAVLFAVSVIVFLVFNVIPSSDPAQRMAGKAATPTLIESINEEWGFDDSLPQQYVKMMENIFTGDLISYEGRENVNERIVEGIPATFSLCLGAAVIWMFFGILFGYLSAVRAGGRLDQVTGLAVQDRLREPAHPVGDRRHVQPGRLQRHQAQRLLSRRADHHVHPPVQRRHVVQKT